MSIIQKLSTHRNGQRQIIASRLKRFEDETENASVSELTSLLTMIEENAETLKSMNDKILDKTELDKVEEEMISTGDYTTDLVLKLARCREVIHKQTMKESSVQRCEEESIDKENKSDQEIRDTEYINDMSEKERSNGQTGGRESVLVIDSGSKTVSSFSSVQSDASQYHKLPKITLPNFSGDILAWHSFWDSFESAVHKNVHLTDVQRFTYLKSQLEGEAACTIEGFALTNGNYMRAIELLKERYGQEHKITHAMMQALLQLPAPVNTVQSIRHFCDKIETYVRGLESLGQFQETYGCLLVPIVLEKLPVEIKKNLARDHGDSNWILADLRKALKKELRIMEAGVSVTSGGVQEVSEYAATASFHTGLRSQKRSFQTKQSTSEYTTPKKTVPMCAYCDENHAAYDCRKYNTVESRIYVIKKDRLCFNCLGKHQVANCRSKNRCRNCKRKHHTSICSAHETGNSTVVMYSSGKQCNTGVLLKTAVATVTFSGTYAEASILFDEGSQRSFITEALADNLNLPSEGTETIQLSAFGGDSNKLQHFDRATVYLVTKTKRSVPVSVLVVPHIASPLFSPLKTAVDKYPYLKRLRLALPVTNESEFSISMLIGSDHYWDIVENDIIRGAGPTAVNSKLGYLLSGPIRTTGSKKSQRHVLNVITSPVSIENALEKFWSLENLGIKADATEDTGTNSSLQRYQELAIDFQDGRYIAKLPWKTDHPPLPSNYTITKKRTESTIQRLRNDPHAFKTYGAIIAEQESRGFIERVSDENGEPAHAHYIPHHPVKKDSSTTPVRIVFDCSCKASQNKPSLNDCLQSTPPILNELTSLLIRFRERNFAVTTDIEKAFLNVGLHEDDRDVTRFLWLEDPNDPDSRLVTYRFKAVLFGATCSPFMLNATLLKHLNLNENNSASQIIERDLYVDNIITSFSTEDEVLDFFTESRQLMITANMNLRSWSSNSVTLCSEAEKCGVRDTDNVTKMLGLRWNPETDTLTFANRTIPSLTEVTKRDILRYSSQIYDPLGFLSPVTIRAKILMQDIWKDKFEWDVALPSDIQLKWSGLADDLNSATNMTYPRQLLNDKSVINDNTCLHVFVDASLKAYGATAYLSNGNSASLIMAKTRVAPLKSLTLPQLELMAALIGARLAKHLLQIVNVKTVHFWSDSQIVLHWIKSSKQCKRFVANRVSEIQEMTKVDNWRYCPTQENPADLLTRGLPADKLLTSKIWMHGPEWLLNTDSWPLWEPVQAVVNTVVEERVLVEKGSIEETTNKTMIQSVISVQNFSSYKRLLRVTAYVMRFIRNTQAYSAKRIKGCLSVQEITQAELLWLRSCQQAAFSEQISDLKSGHARHTLVKQLRLFLDEHGLIRCRGRVNFSSLGKDAKFPFLLPRKDELTKLIVEEAHQIHLHSGINATVAFIRQKFWIPAIRQVVRSVVRKCVTCRRVTGRPYVAPESPPLPPERLQESPPFTVTGVDFAGPVQIKEGNANRNKAYICLFTCASTRAIHLEIVDNLTTDSFIQAFRRFVSRKSMPHIMLSDNATTFTAAASYLHRLSQSSAVQETLSSKGIEWRFIPKRAPWFGGFWERMVGLTKTAMKKTLGKACVDKETLRTVIVEIEAILNDRPLTYVSSNVDDLEPLTPSCLLYGRRIMSFPWSAVIMDTSHSVANLQSITRRAKHIRQMIEQFWGRWRHEYLTALREQHRGSRPTTSAVQVGDVVQVHDDNPRTRWRLAVIEDLLPGIDGHTRAARIRTSQGTTTRPIVKLYPLEVK